MKILSIDSAIDSISLKLIRLVSNQEEIITTATRGRLDNSMLSEAAVEAVLACLPSGIDAIGVRVSHGGSRSDPALVTPLLLKELREAIPLCPQPLSRDLSILGAVAKESPGIPVYAVFETSFHRTMPAVATRYALPLEVSPTIRRYGFHGLAHAFAAGEYFRLAKRPSRGTKLVSLHLGESASVCAIVDGRSVDVSAGFSSLEGLISCTQSGDIDPSAVLTLLRSGKTINEVEALLTHRSGLRGLSGLDNDIRALELAAQNGNQRCLIAWDTFAYRIRKYIGAYAAAMGGLDALVLSGEMAEKSAWLRSRVLDGMEFLGVHIVGEKNTRVGSPMAARLSEESASVDAWIIPTDEKLQIAREIAEIYLLKQ